MNARRLLVCVLTTLLASSCSAPRPRVPATESEGDYFQATIARLERTEPGSPALLNLRLAYGQFLLNGAPGPCAPRVVMAQEQLGSAEASPKARVFFPEGWAGAADLEYRVQLARAECGSQADRKDDLLAAAAAARRAVDLYRKELDYRSMVIMQFDAATVLRQLGDNAESMAALETALDMDREYGFQDDARDNYKLLLTWRGVPAGAAQVAQVTRLMQDFPKRKALFEFRWTPNNAHMTLNFRRDCLEDGRLLHGLATAVYERHIAPDPKGGWSVSHANRLNGYEPGVWPIEPDATAPQLFFPPGRLPALNFKVSASGEFEGVSDATPFSARLTAKTEGRIRVGAPSGVRGRDTMDDAISIAEINLSPGMLEAATAENYQLETAMWIGATLEQGVWYETSAPLSLPGVSQIAVQQHIEFAFTRMVPCTADAAAQSCVEILIRARPDKAALHALIGDLASPFPNTRFADYDASIEVRIVVDPATLLPYAREKHAYWYASFGHDTAYTILEADHLVSTATYATH